MTSAGTDGATNENDAVFVAVDSVPLPLRAVTEKE